MNAHNKVPLLVAVCVACLLLLWWQKYTSQNSNEGGGVVRTSVPAEVVADPSEGHSDVSDGRGSRQEVGVLDASIDEELADVSANSTEVNTPAIQGFTTEDVEALRSNLENLYTNASRDELIQGYKNAFALMPPGLIEELHKEHVDAGEYEVLNVPVVKEGEPYIAPEVRASPLAHGLVRVTILPDGRSVKTELELGELGRHAGCAVELGWFELAIGRSRPPGADGNR